MSIYLSDFHMIRPHFEEDQATLLEWIAKTHAETQKRVNNWDKKRDALTDFQADLRKNLFKIGLGKGKIKKRGFHISDCTHTNWQKMGVYNIEDSPSGHLLDRRMDLFKQMTLDIFKRMYPEKKILPKHMIHVTCTGYVAPSPAQELISSRNECYSTIVTHAYHMGCYAAIPSVRIAMGHLYSHREATDIVHTELASLHMNPLNHSTEQLIVQSLFADGFIKYSIGGETSSSTLKILTIHEEMIGNSTSKMSWFCRSWGFEMTLAKEIPVLIRRNLELYLKRLAKKAELSFNKLLKARFALHPGGRKIIDQIAEKLQLSPCQIEHSQWVFSNYGNMSSATLPHIWQKMSEDEAVKEKELIVSLAFGPGITISGALFEKQ